MRPHPPAGARAATDKAPPPRPKTGADPAGAGGSLFLPLFLPFFRETSLSGPTRLYPRERRGGSRSDHQAIAPPRNANERTAPIGLSGRQGTSVRHEQADLEVGETVSSPLMRVHKTQGACRHHERTPVEKANHAHHACARDPIALVHKARLSACAQARSAPYRESGGQNDSCHTPRHPRAPTG